MKRMLLKGLIGMSIVAVLCGCPSRSADETPEASPPASPPDSSPASDPSPADASPADTAPTDAVPGDPILDEQVDAPERPIDDEAIAAHNRAVGLMGRFEYREARDIFADLIKTHTGWIDARVNLAIATLNRQEEGDAQRALDILADVLADDPEHLRARYCTGLIRLYLGEPANALDHFTFVADRDPDDAYAAYYVGQCLATLGRPGDALPWFETAITLDPYLRSGYYGQAQALQRLGRSDEAAEMIAQFTRLENNPRSRLVEFVYTKFGDKAMARAVDASDAPPATDPPDGDVFGEAAPLIVLPDDAPAGWRTYHDRPASIAAADINANGRLDLFIASALDGADNLHNAVLLQQRDGSFAIDFDHALARIASVHAALFGDYDNDGMADVYLCRAGPNMLWRQSEPGQWIDVTSTTGTVGGDLDTVNGLFVDADHDGDLDLLLANADGPNELLNNNLDGTFTPIAQQQGIAGDGRASRQILAVDLDGDRDLDMVVINNWPPHEIYLNDRMWAYRSIAEIGDDNDRTDGSAPAERYADFVRADVCAIVPADVDADGRIELYTVDRAGNVRAWQEDESGVLSQRPHTTVAIPSETDDNAMVQIAVADVRGDGTAELLCGAAGAWVALNLPEARMPVYTAPLDGLAGWTSMTLDAAHGPAVIGMVSGDGPAIWRPGSGRFNYASLAFTGVDITGEPIRTNASGIGTRFAARIGSNWTAGATLPSRSGPGQSLDPVAIGLGGHPQIDFVAIDWSNGIYQSEIDLAAGEAHVIRQTQRQLSSCPIIFAWNGEQYEFVSDVLGVAGIGFAVAPGVYYEPRPWEHFLFPEGFLQPRPGEQGDSARAYHIKIGEPMEEVLYLDAARLVAYDLPPAWQMTLDERFAAAGPEATGEPRFYRDHMLPTRAVNDRGDDVTESVRAADGIAAPPGEHDVRFIGRLARDHVLTLEFDAPIDAPASGAAGSGVDLRATSPILIADGWIEYPYSQTMFAAWQAGADYRPPTIEARDADGHWHVVLEQFGYPAGMPRQMSVPLPDLPSGTMALRITTNQEIYWDRIAMAHAVVDPPPGARITPLDLREARLHRPGYALNTPGPQRRPSYDYTNRAGQWDTRYSTGAYTRFGDVRELVGHADDALAIIGPGEEIHLAFDAARADLPPGWTRRFVIECDGWCKDMDLFTRTGETLAPLPSRGDPDSPREAWHRQYNTRFMSGR